MNPPDAKNTMPARDPVVTVGMVSLGCAKNVVDGEVMLGHLEAGGIRVTADADDADVVVGVLTERDCIAAATSANYYGEWGGPAGQFMSSPVEYVGPDDNLVDVAERMAKSVFRRYPVMEEGRLVGLLARRDVMRALTTSSP